MTITRSPSDHVSSDSFVFSAVDELDEAARALGWRIDYRQLSRGDFTAGFTFSENHGMCLVAERFNNHLRIHAEPPEGFVGIFFPDLGSGRAAACGRTLSEAELILFPSRAELELVTRGEIGNETMFLTEAEFRAAARSLAPSSEVLAPGSAAIQHGDPDRFAAIRRSIDAVHRTGHLDSETASALLASTILWITEGSSTSSADRLRSGAAATVVRRAQTFIEDRFRFAIRLEALCAFAGVGLRTLQRCFTSQFQTSPTLYIKARRLQAARSDLQAADPSTHTVAEIALGAGLSHLGRFAADYRAHFGESPRETLAATRSS